MNDKALTVIDQRVALVQEDLKYSDALVQQVLKPGVDYGLHPGTSSYVLKDPGANTLINAFNCYPKADVLFREVSEVMISYVFDVALVSREDGQVKTTGTGAASTKEVKYGYRWVTDPEAYGYAREDLRHRVRNNQDQYKIVNPEWSELENTIVKQARKRAEVDAAMALPGVSRFIAGLNTPEPVGKQQRPPANEFTPFWKAVRDMDVTADEVHTWLSVSSMKDWIAQGKTLDDAIRLIAEYAASRKEEGVSDGQ